MAKSKKLNTGIAECRNLAIQMNLPLYFVYHEETGILDIYITKTNELFEKRRCSKYMPRYEFEVIANNYLDNYLYWKADNEQD